MRKIPVKNYAIAVVIMIITILATFISASIYLDNVNVFDKEYLKNLSEIKIDEIDNYIIEAHDIMIYATDSESTNKYVDREFEKIINKYNLSQDIVYLNLNEIDDTLYKEFIKKYNINGEINSNTLLIFKDGTLSKIINLNERNVELTNKYINNFYGE